MIPVCSYCNKGLSKREIKKNRKEKSYRKRCNTCEKELKEKFPL